MVGGADAANQKGARSASRACVSVRNVRCAVCDVLRLTVAGRGVVIRLADGANVGVCEERLTVGNSGGDASVASELEVSGASETDVLVQEVRDAVWNVLRRAALGASQIVTVSASPATGGVEEQAVVVAGDRNADSIVRNEANHTISAGIRVRNINVAKWHVLRVANAKELVKAGSARLTAESVSLVHKTVRNGNPDANAVCRGIVCCADNAKIGVLLVEQTVGDAHRQTLVVLQVESVRTCKTVVSVVLEERAVLHGDRSAGVVGMQVEVGKTDHALAVDHGVAVARQTGNASSVNQQKLVGAGVAKVTVLVITDATWD